MESLENFKYLYFLTKVKNLGNVRIRRLISAFGSPEDCFKAQVSQLKKVDGISERTAGDIVRISENLTKYDEEFESLCDKLERKGIKITMITESDYPENLKAIYDAPVLLYYKGNLDEKDRYSLSVVGTRVPTEYGKDVCAKIVKELSAIGIPIISGMARGIDSIAHLSALKKDNLTYAVLGSGVDVIYPAENKELYYKMCEKGAVISELEPGAQPDRVNFPMRNRILSGISLGTLVIETGLTGGSMITASLALDQNKEVFAIPGNINSVKSIGTNELIKRGHAKIVSGVDDILLELEAKLKPVLKERPALESNESIVRTLTGNEKKLFGVIEDVPLHIDEINELAGLSIPDCLVSLLSLEFKGLVRQMPGKNFIRVS